MPPSDPIATARSLLSDAVSSQNQRLQASIAQMLADNEAQGKLRSNETLKQGTLLCCEMLENRADAIVAALKGVIVDGNGARQAAKSDYKRLVAEFLPREEAFVSDQLTSIISRIGAPNVLAQLQEKVEKTRAKMQRRLGVEIDLLFRRSQSDEAAATRPRHMYAGLLIAEVALLAAAGWYTYTWIADPSTIDGVLMAATSVAVLVVNRYRRLARDDA
ncbi:MAG: hypothetical protein R3286_21105 [Gammaproteobacteria bacterium]|nr:hypothetical protein [Gammaproteobacteria bacterium]